jgi:hypothetical protein
MVHKLKRLHRNGDMILERIINKATTEIGGDESLLSYLLSLKEDVSSNPIGFHLTINNIKAVIQVNLYSFNKNIILGTNLINNRYKTKFVLYKQN